MEVIQYIMTLLFQVFQILFSYLGCYSVKKKNILTFYVISTIFSMLMFWSVGKYAAILPILTTGIRYFVFIFKDKYKNKIPFYLCLLLHIIALFLSVKTTVDIIPSLLVIAGCFIYWYLDDIKLKASMFILNIPWIAYYFYCGLYLTTLNVIIQSILIGIAYLKLRKQKDATLKH